MRKFSLGFFRSIFVPLVFFVISGCTSDQWYKPQKKVEIAILMPLSGPFGSQGKKLSEIIRYGVEDNLNGIITSTVYDIATEDLIEQALYKIGGKKTQLILGPLFTPSVNAIEHFAHKNNIPILTLSNNPLLAKENMVYVFGHAPLKQTHQLIKYLTSNDYNDFILLSPRTKNSENLKRVISELLKQNNARLHTPFFYDASESNTETSDIKTMIAKIADKVDEILEDDNNEKRPVILISEDNKQNLSQIFQEIAILNLDKKAVIAGDSRIDIKLNHNIEMIYVGSTRLPEKTLFTRIQDELNIDQLGYLEAIAYDVGAFAAVAVNQSFEREAFLSRINSMHWYKALSGDLRFQGGMSERRYGVIKKIGQKYYILESYEDSN